MPHTSALFPAPDTSASLGQRVAGLLALSALVCAFAASPVQAADGSALPAEQHSEGVSYITGGVDLDQSTAIKAAMPGYPLVVEVFNSAGGKNEYTAASKLSIRNPAGKVVFTTDLQGPFALLKLAPGRYDVTVDYEGQTRQRRIEVTSGRSARATFVFGGA